MKILLLHPSRNHPLLAIIRKPFFQAIYSHLILNRPPTQNADASHPLQTNSNKASSTTHIVKPSQWRQSAVSTTTRKTDTPEPSTMIGHTSVKTQSRQRWQHLTDKIEQREVPKNSNLICLRYISKFKTI